MIDNNVKILPVDEVKKYFKYCGRKFKNYLWYHNFKHKKSGS